MPAGMCHSVPIMCSVQKVETDLLVCLLHQPNPPSLNLWILYLVCDKKLCLRGRYEWMKLHTSVGQISMM